MELIIISQYEGKLYKIIEQYNYSVFIFKEYRKNNRLIGCLDEQIKKIQSIQVEISAECIQFELELEKCNSYYGEKQFTLMDMPDCWYQLQLIKEYFSMLETAYSNHNLALKNKLPI